MGKSTSKVRDAAETARPYVEKAITDEEFRESLRAAFIAARQIYDELMPQKGDRPGNQGEGRGRPGERHARGRRAPQRGRPIQDAEKGGATASATSS